MKIGLLSDTHSYLDPKVFEYFSEVDEVWHAGDFGVPEVANQLEAFRPLRGVYGNIDENTEIERRFPLDLRFEVAGLRVFMTHIGGYPGRYNLRTKKLLMADPPDLFISGHSHILKVMPDHQLDLLHINPGACGREGFHQVRTITRFEIIDSKVTNLQIIELGARG